MRIDLNCIDLVRLRLIKIGAGVYQVTDLEFKRSQFRVTMSRNLLAAKAAEVNSEGGIDFKLGANFLCMPRRT